MIDYMMNASVRHAPTSGNEMSLMLMALPIIIALIFPFVVVGLVFLIKKVNERKFKKRYGYTPKDYKQIQNLKKLLDEGIITQQEFDAKKAKLLDL